MIQRLLFGSGGEHCDLAFAVERSGGGGEEGGEGGGPANKNIKNSNNPDLTFGEKRFTIKLAIFKDGTNT